MTCLLVKVEMFKFLLLSASSFLCNFLLVALAFILIALVDLLGKWQDMNLITYLIGQL